MKGINYYFRGTKSDEERADIIELLDEMNVEDVAAYAFDDPGFIYFTYDKDGKKLINFEDYDVLKHILIENPHPGFIKLEKEHGPLYKKGDWVNWKNTLIGEITEISVNINKSYSYCVGNTLWASERELTRTDNPIKG